MDREPPQPTDQKDLGVEMDTSTPTPDQSTLRIDEKADQSMLRSLHSTNYFHGLLPREDLCEVLRNKGDFLLRMSQPNAEDRARQVIISVKCGGQVNEGMRHVVVRKVHGKFQVDPSLSFSRVDELVNHYVSEGLPLIPDNPDSQLLAPAKRLKWELRNENVELGRTIGSGNFGTVYRGRLKQKRQNLDVAVKIASFNLTKAKIKELMREARLMRKLNHPNVVKLYGVALDKEPLQIVMEYVRGGSLDSFLRFNKVSNEEKLEQMCLGSALGIEYLHRKNFLHRDIAARNCLYDKNKRIKISDFGLSREGETYKLTSSRRVPYKYLALETFTTYLFSRKTDVWAYGVMLWEIFTNAAEPFSDKRMGEVKQLLTDGKRLEFPAGTPDNIRELAAQTWKAVPEERPKMSEIVVKLEQMTNQRHAGIDLERKRRSSDLDEVESEEERRDSIQPTGATVAEDLAGSLRSVAKGRSTPNSPSSRLSVYGRTSRRLKKKKGIGHSRRSERKEQPNDDDRSNFSVSTMKAPTSKIQSPKRSL
ncbi:Tyrosine-protein kinase [Aphelenchoides besseyi]|nr:Tyrosine-protein kinase [Aphelenchoides besseyi]